MDMQITRFPLRRFRELVPLLMRCFPEFWAPRLAEKKYSFPYDLKLFAAYIDGKLMGCIGVHEYRFYLEGNIYSCGGVSDVAVDPDHRGRGYALQLQNFVLEYCKRNYRSISLLPLYTDKPGVYTRLGWKVYESDPSTAVKSCDFPPGNVFKFRAPLLDIRTLQGRKAPANEDERKALHIMEIYNGGKVFNGKCCRSVKTWWELFTDSHHFWTLKDETFCLYREDILLETYSLTPGYEKLTFTPCHGGHDSNKVMVNLPRMKYESDRLLARALEERTFVFPAADVF